MTAWRSSGDVLRWWRTDVLALTQQDAAERLNVKPSALSNWERGEREISLQLSEVDEALKGEGALEGLLWAFGTPEGLDAGQVWTNVFPGESRPVWMWLRSSSKKLALQAEWGLARVGDDLELGPNGLFVTVAASLPDSPATVYLSKPGWADFGFGSLPDDVPGAPVIDAATIFGRSSADGAFMQMFSNSLASKLSSGRPEAIDLAAAAPEAVSSYTNTAAAGSPGAAVPRRWPPATEGIEALVRARFAALREARGLSLSSLADRLNNDTGIGVGRDTLRRFETDVGRPHDPMLPVALDYILGAGGRLALLELRAGRGSGATWFPHYWRGPIWMRLVNEGGPAEIRLRRGSWQRELSVTESALVSAHWFEPSDPFRIEAGQNLRWTVGVGRRAGADAIDHNWAPDAVDVAQEAVAQVEEAMLRAVDRGRHGRGDAGLGK